jgi:hypothetical protein
MLAASGKQKAGLVLPCQFSSVAMYDLHGVRKKLMQVLSAFINVIEECFRFTMQLRYQELERDGCDTARFTNGKDSLTREDGRLLENG